MAERYNATDINKDGDEFSPEERPIFQIERRDGANGVVSFMGKNDASLPWVLLRDVDASGSLVIEVRALKIMKISVAGNSSGKLIRVHDNA